MVGTFLKFPTTQTVEILGALGFDFVVIDQEHAPLDRVQIDMMCLAARASGIAPVVRVGDPEAANVLSALDCGALGIMFPHVASVRDAADFVARCRYKSGVRGFVGLSRASGWGSLSGVEFMASQDSEVAVIAMIEDQHAVEEVPRIAVTPGLDAIFVGRGDLGASFGDDPEGKSKVAALAKRIAADAAAAGKPLLMLATSTEDAAAMRALGAASLLVGSDHGFFRTAAAQALKTYKVGI